MLGGAPKAHEFLPEKSCLRQSFLMKAQKSSSCGSPSFIDSQGLFNRVTIGEICDYLRACELNLLDVLLRSLTAVRIGALGRDSINNEFAALVVEIENLRRQTLTALKRENADRADVGFLQPILPGKFGD